MAQAFGITRMRLERIGDERDRTNEKIQDLLALAEEEQRDQADYEKEQITKYRTRRSVSSRTRFSPSPPTSSGRTTRRTSPSSSVQRKRTTAERRTRAGQRPRVTVRAAFRCTATYAEYAIDVYAIRYPMIAERAAPNGNVREFVEQAQERLERAPVNTLSSNVPGLVPPRHIAQIMDLINASRPVVNSGRQLALDRGTLTYPKIAQRPEVLVQASEKTEGGTKNLQVTLESLTAADVPRWRRHLLAGDELVKPGHPAVVVRPRCRGVRTGNRVGGLRGSREPPPSARSARRRVVSARLARRTSRMACGSHRGHLGDLHGHGRKRPHRTRCTCRRTGSSSLPDSAPTRRCRSRLSAHSTSAP